MMKESVASVVDKETKEKWLRLENEQRT